MALRNAFENLSTEEKQDAILDALSLLIDELNQQNQLMPIQRALPYARDVSDQMRVNIGSSTTLSVQSSRAPHLDSGGSNVTWYSATPQVTTMDAREQQRSMSRNNYILQRQKWTIS